MFQKYFEDEGTEIKQLEFLWCSAARYSRVEVMQWAHEQGYSVIWNLQNDWGGSIGATTCATKAVKYGQLYALQWLKQNGCDWGSATCFAAAAGGHLSCLQ